MRERRSSGEIVLQRRRAERAPFHTEVTCLFGDVSFSAITMNLSTTGCFVETGTPVPLLAAVDVILHLSDDLARAKVGGHVVRTHLHPADTLGFAVMFDCIDDARLCYRSPSCVTRDVWQDLNKAITAVLERITLEEMAQKQRERTEKGRPEKARAYRAV